MFLEAPRWLCACCHAWGCWIKSPLPPHLEIAQVEGSLLHFLDRAATPAGRRKVRQFIANPLFRCV